MYKLYSQNNQIIVESGGATVYVVPVNSSRIQVIDGNVTLYDLFNRSNSFGTTTFFMGPLANVTGSSNQSFANEDALYDYYVSISGGTTNTSSLTDGTQVTRLIDASANAVYPSGEPRTLTCEYVRPANSSARIANGAVNETSPVIRELVDSIGRKAANLNGGGGLAINGSLTSNNTSDVGRQFGIIILNDDVSTIVIDNSTQTINYSDSDKRVSVQYVTMTAQPPGSDCVIGRFDLPFEYTCKEGSKSLKALLFDVTGGTTAASSKYKVKLNVQVQK